MKRMWPIFLVLALLVTQIAGCSLWAGGDVADYQLAPLQIGVSRHPEAANFNRGVLKTLPKYDSTSTEGWQVDLRGRDVTGLSLAGRLDDLLHADFDSVTKWPGELPEGFDPERIMELGRDPGLGIRQLHEQGITGKGISIAIIDQCLLVDHAEYQDRLRHYEEIHNQEERSTMHGAAVASIAVGKTVGVAPGADLYYIAETHGNFTLTGFAWDFGWLAKSVDRILEINETLTDGEKIRVIAMAIGWNAEQKGYQEIVDAVERAKQAGIFVVSSSLRTTYDGRLTFHGLGREPYADPNEAESYGPGSWWASSFYEGKAPAGANTLLFPMDSRCTASPTGTNDYVFYSQGGWSWSIPYIAGLYALACQVKPEVTPDEFWRTGVSTGDCVEFEHEGQTYSLGTVVNPGRLLAGLSGK